MYTVKKFVIGEDFVESARAAIKGANKENGYPPNEVMVHPTTDTGGATTIAVALDGLVQEIPVSVRDDLKIGFGLAENEALLDVCDPNSPLE